jgi:lipopolysaccharide/colanic/teichoic acid biosynthesis glycosyltransferase
MYIDEIPQAINVLKNEMSIVGPRPERPFFVNKLKNEIPYYYKRLSVKPGITGWAQIKHKYDSSLEDVKAKLQYDFYYIENMSLKLDFKIIINTIIVVLLMKGH